MKTIRSVSTVAVVVMVVAIGWAFTAGDFAEEGSVILGLPWGVVSIIDIYVGAILILGWIRWRDGTAAAVVWFVVLFVLGHLGSALYIAWRAWTSPDVPTLLLGPRRTLAATVNPLSGGRQGA